MTMQSRDYFYYKGQRFTLIDVEKGKQIIDYGRFNIPKVSRGAVQVAGAVMKRFIVLKKAALGNNKRAYFLG